MRIDKDTSFEVVVVPVLPGKLITSTFIKTTAVIDAAAVTNTTIITVANTSETPLFDLNNFFSIYDTRLLTI